MKTKFMMVSLLAAGSLLMGQKPKSPKERDAVQAVFSAQTPDQKITAVDDLLTKFKDTEFKAIALNAAAEAYQEKGDSANAIVYGNRALEADPKSFQAMLLVSRQLAQITKQFDLDKDEKLKRATKLANDAIVAVNAATKPNPQLSDDQWAGYKKDFIADGHETLGMIASVDKKWDTSVTEFKMAVDEAANPEPSAMIRLANAYNSVKKYDEAIALADKVLASPGIADVFKKAATEEKARAAKGKGQ